MVSLFLGYPILVSWTIRTCLVDRVSDEFKTSSGRISGSRNNGRMSARCRALSAMTSATTPASAIRRNYLMSSFVCHFISACLERKPGVPPHKRSVLKKHESA